MNLVGEGHTNIVWQPPYLRLFLGIFFFLFGAAVNGIVFPISLSIYLSSRQNFTVFDIYSQGNQKLFLKIIYLSLIVFLS